MVPESVQTILLAATLAATFELTGVETLHLRAGGSLPVSGAVVLRGDAVTFRHANGTLYSIRTEEVDFAATRRLDRPRIRDEAWREDSGRSIAVSEDEARKLFKALEGNHRGKPAPPQRWETERPAPQRRPLETTPARDEWSWRREARQLEEGVRQAKEELQLLLDREQALQDQILSLLGSGYRPSQFSYQVLQLEHARGSMDRARLQVTRAERAFDQFRDDARRQGILPGWLR